MRYILYFILIPALLPVFLILRYVYSLDKVEREPIGFVMKVLIFGAIFSIPCAFLEQYAERIIDIFFDPQTLEYAWVENTFGIALIEELSKWLVFMKLVWNNDNFDYRYDGIVYAVSASLGFAALENVLYVVSFGTEVSIGRAIFSIPGHTTFGVFMGYFLSRAKHFNLNQKRIRETFCILMSLAMPIVIHGLYDFLLSDQVEAADFQYIFYLYVLFLDYWAQKVIKHEFRTDRRL